MDSNEQDSQRSVLEVIDHTGDTKTMWDPSNEAEVAVARKTFEGLTAEGYVAYQVDKEGNAGAVMRTFDPDAGRIIMRPPMQGG